jgi:hypothetical protein
MTATHATQRYDCARHIYDKDGYYILCTAVLDIFGAPVVGGGYRELGAITFADALAIRLGPRQALRHCYGEKVE